MTMTGVYRIALLPSADEEAFVKHLTQVVFKDPDVMQLTRITRGFTHELWKTQGLGRQYVWKAKADLQTNVDYDFGENIERVEKAVQDFGLVIGVDTYTRVDE